ncbi:unnamed protein product [Heterobilharzia americana]|nr:unnamed protein product [Heterobilharzia americana]
MYKLHCFRRWWIKQIPKTNLFFIINIAPPGSQTVLCKCNCQKRFRYGARIANILFACLFFHIKYENNF